MYQFRSNASVEIKYITLITTRVQRRTAPESRLHPPPLWRRCALLEHPFHDAQPLQGRGAKNSGEETVHTTPTQQTAIAGANLLWPGLGGTELKKWHVTLLPDHRPVTDR
jgi:hypothetical protein